MSFGIKRTTVVRPAGQIIVVSDDGTVEADTLQCVHCQAHWTVKPGSGRRRGWCFKCAGPTCGKQCCDVCVPAEKQLEIMEEATKRRSDEATKH